MIALAPFEFGMRTRVAFGCGAVQRLGEFGRSLSSRRALIVTDPGIVGAGHVARAQNSLHEAGIETRIFADVRENPTTEDVARGLEVARGILPDLLVAIGGGSSMDCAKGINFLYTNGGEMRDYWGIGKARDAMLPAIAIPTTAGTGSEAQSFALISDPVTHQKMACGDPKAAFRIAILDPELTCSQPASVTALTGIDAMAHAIETHVTRTRNPFSQLYSRDAWRLLIKNLPQVLRDGDDLSARGGMQLGAHWAGVAIEHSMLGAAHSLANPLTAQFGIVHGHAVGIMLPAVIRVNTHQVSDLYRELTRIGHELGMLNSDTDSLALSEFIQSLCCQAGLKLQLRDLGVPRGQLGALAEDAAQQWTLKFNPVRLDVADLERLYQEVY